MSYFEHTIIAETTTPSDPRTGRCALRSVEVARIIARHYCWVLTDLGRVRQPVTVGGQVVAESIDELAGAIDAVGWRPNGYPFWLDMPHQERAAAERIREYLRSP